jgi:hypothetical protein
MSCPNNKRNKDGQAESLSNLLAGEAEAHAETVRAAIS